MADFSSIFRLDGAKAVVVGAASGMGRASAVGLADFGAEVVVADVDEAGGRATVEEIERHGHKATFRPLDVRDAEQIRQAATDESDAEILVITPGINVRKPLLDTTDEDFDRVVDVNLKGTYRLIREFGRPMSERGSGSIIAFASFRALVVEPGQGIYAATKAGMVQLVRALAAELGPRGVRVNAIAPGAFETPLTEQIKADEGWYAAYRDKSVLKRWAQSEEIVGSVVFLASGASSFTTGTLHMVDGGWTAADGRFEPRLG